MRPTPALVCHPAIATVRGNRTTADPAQHSPERPGFPRRDHRASSPRSPAPARAGDPTPAHDDGGSLRRVTLPNPPHRPRSRPTACLRKPLTLQAFVKPTRGLEPRTPSLRVKSGTCGLLRLVRFLPAQGPIWPRQAARRLRLYPDVPLPTHCPRRHPPASSGSRRRAAACGCSPRACTSSPTRLRDARARSPSVEPHAPVRVAKVRGRPAAGEPEQPPARSTRRTIRAAELATSARAETWPEIGQARSGVDRPACGGCATLPEANRALGPAHAECRDADEHKRAAAAAELLARVNTGAGVVSLNPANASSHRGRAAAASRQCGRLGQAPIAAVARP
jgi:hypothetical protein